jgi:MYXO-CTERM domain-containing protein
MARLARFWKPLLTITLVFLVFACSGGGCSSCEGCGVRPIPGAFPLDARIPNAAQIRLSESGIGFIEDNIGGIVGTLLEGGLEFPVPETGGSIEIPILPDVNYTVCPEGRTPPCIVHAEISDLELTPEAPNVLHAVIQLQLWSTDGTGEVSPLFVDTSLGDLNVTLDSRRGDRAFVAFETDVTFATETAPARVGYTRIDVGAISEVAGQGIQDADISISGSGFGGTIISFFINLFKSTIVNLLRDQIAGLTDGLVGDNLCTTRGAYGCPSGTFDRGNTAEDAVCYLNAASGGADDRCVPLLLGTDGRGDLGEAFLGGISPGAHAPIQFVLAAGGDGEAIANGMSLFMVGGFQSWNRDFTTTPGHNACVPLIEAPPLPTVTRAAAFRGNTIPGTAIETHVGIGISEDYLDYAGYGLFDSGTLCIGTGTPLAQELSTGLVSALINSLSALAFPAENAALAISLRPQQPMEFEIGTDSGSDLLTITLPQLQMDFYVWSTERYVRFMTFQTDLAIGINLTVEGSQLVPTITGVTPTNSSVTNSELLTEMPTRLAGTLETLIGMFAGMFTSAISPFDLPEIMGFNLVVPDGGIRGVSSDGETFLGIFANLELAGGSPLVAPVETSVTIADLVLDRDSMSLETWNTGDGNSAWLYFEAEGPAGADFEFSYRIDGGNWSPWTTDRRLQITDDALLFQARHNIEARGRVVGEFASVDATPARASLLVDILQPTVVVDTTETGWNITGRDVITTEGDLEIRYRLPEGEWSEWHVGPLTIEQADVEGVAGDFGIEVRDEAGNVASSVQPIIRGIPDPGLEAGCGCRVEGPPAQPLFTTLLVGVCVAFFARRSRKGGPRKENARKASTFRSVITRNAVTARVARLFGVTLAVMMAGALAIGCSCGEPMGGACGDACAPPTGTMLRGSICCESSDECVAYNLNDLCDPGFTCPIDEVTIGAMSCEVSCGGCVARPPLSGGLLATDLDFVSSTAGDFVSGYSPGNPPLDIYGDLVFGEVVDGEVNWEIIEGAPSSPIEADPSGWRGGVRTPGDDVGRWTSMVDSGENIYIAYHDVTNGELKMAIGGAGSWDIHTIDDNGTSGAYASLVLLPSGAPAVSYLRIETQEDGTVRSSVYVAVASSAMPSADSDWTLTEVAGAVTPCRAADCALGQVCTEAGSCAMTGSCTPDCASDEECVAGSCTAVFASNWVEDLAPRYGMYTHLVTTSAGLALVWYDRSTGNLWGAEATGTTFGAAFLIDGYARVAPVGEFRSGDCGIGASLFVDDTGTWHVTYVDGAEEQLRYSQVSGGAVTLRELIDDGSTNGSEAHDDGRHVIGDDSSVVVTSTGEVRVAYQDSTDAVTMLARRTGAGTWTVSVIDDVDASGFWVEQVVTTSGSSVASFWRRNEPGNPNGVHVTAIP